MPMTGRPADSTIGQYDGDGMWMCASAFSSCSARISSAVATWTSSPSSFSSYLRWKNSSRVCTVGTASKLWALGGLVVIHS